MDTQKQTPLGIKVITILTVISGIVLLIMSFLSFAVLIGLGPAGMLGTGFLAALGTASIVVSFGLYRGRSWAWTLLLVLAGFGAAGYLFNMVNGRLISIVGVIINSIIIYYLYRPHIRRFFGRI
ncbi:MAG: hypothetical protein M3162_03375 [Thermoproteota archaeon]|nr:hypothetical protein [Thermoproteota archaeon]